MGEKLKPSLESPVLLIYAARFSLVSHSDETYRGWHLQWKAATSTANAVPAARRVLSFASFSLSRWQRKWRRLSGRDPTVLIKHIKRGQTLQH